MKKLYLLTLPLLIAISGCSKPPQAQPPKPLALSGSSSGFHILVEAEDAGALSGGLKPVDDKGAGGGKCLRIGPKPEKGTPPPEPGTLAMTVKAPKSGKAQFWFRTHWSGSCSNSFVLKLPNSPERLVGEDGTYKHWHWIKGPKVELAAGDTPVKLSQREYDIGIDQILITTDLGYVPVDIEE
jgi:hypothetical protein